MLLVPCGMPAHRPLAIASSEQRVEMLRLAIAQQPWLQLDTREAFSDGPCYTFDTLVSLRQQHADVSWHLVMGADAFLSLPSWKNWQQLFSLAHVVVATRPGYQLKADDMDEALRQQWQRRRVDDPVALHDIDAGAICCVDLATDDISSSQARDLIKTGQDTTSILHPAVAAFIMRQHLYSSGGHS